MGLNKNAPCWCGSGKKYKACHQKFDDQLNVLRLQRKQVPSHDLIKNAEDIKWIKKAAEINNAILDALETMIQPGMTTQEIDDFVYRYTVDHRGIPADLGFEGYPKSVCTSINEVVCHGVPSDQVVLKEGDIINVDCTTIFHEHFADASRMYMVGQVSDEARRLVEVTKECLQKGIEAVRPWGYVGDIGRAIQAHAHKNGYSVVRDYGGHGVGNAFHEDPMVLHYNTGMNGMVLTPGMVFTIEPMINQGTHELVLDQNDGWTVRTRDGKLSAQWENTLYVTEHGVEILAW